jgi:2-methylisocitrate lyase-like PEP mutase family enzyme
VNARTDISGADRTIQDAIKRDKAYLAAGATTAFAWGGPGGHGVSREEIKDLVKAFDGKLNVKLKQTSPHPTRRRLVLHALWSVPNCSESQ